MQNLDHYEEFKDYDRFSMPDGIARVTAGSGGEAYLIDCKGKVALYDCGMAYCHDELLKNIKEKLAEWGYDNLDYALLSHTHYDHIGALPYIIKEYPKIVVIAAPKAEKVFLSEGAKKTMKRLGEAAREDYGSEYQKSQEILVSPLRVDIAAYDMQDFEIGEKTIRVVFTPGHTDCSVCYLVLPDSIMFLSESTGVLRGPEYLTTAILKDYKQSIESAYKCKMIGAKTLIGSHFGRIPAYYNDRYFDLFLETAEKEKETIVSLYNKGASFDELLECYKDMNWTVARGKVQPYEAFLENANYIIRHLVEKFGDKKEN